VVALRGMVLQWHNSKFSIFNSQSFSAMNDLKFAFRQFLKNPGFTAVAVFTLAPGASPGLAFLQLK